MSSEAARYRHSLRPRYADIDAQGVVYNAHYLAYCDEAADAWMRSLFSDSERESWDVILKKVEITWSGATQAGESLDIDIAIRRWGRTSFDVGFAGSVAGRLVFEAVITYVCVRRGTLQPIPVADDVRARLA